jgi:hypothetical protein
LVNQRVIVCCLAPEDGQESGSARQPRIKGPLYAIWPKASKGLTRLRRVLQNPDHGLKSHRRLLHKGHREQVCKGLLESGRPLCVFPDSAKEAWLRKTVKGLGKDEKQSLMPSRKNASKEVPHLWDAA